jgi:hypothetical protein
MEARSAPGLRDERGPSAELVLCAIGLIIQAFGLIGFALWVGIFGGYPAALLLGFIVCIPVSVFGAAAVLTDPPSGPGTGRLQRLMLIVTVAAEACLVALLLFRVLENLVEASTFGIDGRLDAVRLGLAAVGTLLLAGCLRAPALDIGARRPDPGQLRLRRITAVAAVTVATGLFAAAVAGATISRHTLRCSPFSFDKARWDSAGMGLDRVRIGNALARCGTLEGKTKSEVAGMLGIKPGQRFVYLGTTGNRLFNHTTTLTISYDRDGRVTGAKVPHERAMD